MADKRKNVRMIAINGREAMISGADDVDLDQVIGSSQFREWVEKQDPRFYVRGVHIYGVIMFGTKVGFIFQNTDVVDAKRVAAGVAKPRSLDGASMMRGGCVAVLLILASEEKEFAVVVQQPRLPVGKFNFVEIPAGMLDGSKNFSGTAAKEIEEETGLVIRSEEFIQLHPRPLCVSPGGIDETMSFYLVKRHASEDDIASLRGKRTGLRTEGERLIVGVVPLSQLEELDDMKTQTALGLYARWKSAQSKKPSVMAPDSMM